MNTAAINGIFEQTDRELWLLTAACGSRRGGLIATFVSAASIVPELPRVIVGVARHHYSHELIEGSRAFALHLLGEEHLDWVWRFGLRSGREMDKLEGLDWKPAPSGSPCLTAARAWLDCRVEACLDTGDRTIYLAEVLDGGENQTGSVLTMKRVLQMGPPEKLSEMKRTREADAVIDAAAIRVWRQSNLSPQG
jgi:flavin reductase (DIM6/NTAB) family NADH-FMN oxidoreductase RutF